MRIVTLPAIVLVLWLAGCGAQEPVSGEFGAYEGDHLRFRLSDTDTLTVYRVKGWSYGDGSPTALQIEYRSPVPFADTAALRDLARTIWPEFVPYVEGLGLESALLIATRMERDFPAVWTIEPRHFGWTASRRASGEWYLEGSARPLPPARAEGEPRLLTPEGVPIPPPQRPAGR